MLARTLEAEGLSTILVTNMPFWADKIGVPRTLAVEFPFGHALGHAANHCQNKIRVLPAAVAQLADFADYFILGVLPYRTGIINNYISGLGIGGLMISGPDKLVDHKLGIELVHLAAHRFKVKSIVHFSFAHILKHAMRDSNTPKQV